MSHRGVHAAAAVWVAGHVLALVLAPEGLPFDRPDMIDESVSAQLLFADLLLAEGLLVMGVVWALTRQRPTPDLAARVPPRPLALRETLLVLSYAALGQVGGVLLGLALGWHAFSFHLIGTLHGTREHVAAAEALTWAGYNLVIYAVLPYLIFRRRYSREQLGLRSTNRRNDAIVIAAVLLLGGLTYTAVHAADGWAEFTTASSVALSAIFLLGQYFGPGMVKTYLTLRTGNAWAHVWAYHALAPHVLLDTPLVVEIFDVK